MVRALACSLCRRMPGGALVSVRCGDDVQGGEQSASTDSSDFGPGWLCGDGVYRPLCVTDFGCPEGDQADDEGVCNSVSDPDCRADDQSAAPSLCEETVTPGTGARPSTGNRWRRQ